MSQEARYQAGRYRRWQAEKLAELRYTKGIYDRQQIKTMADFYGKQADEYEARANSPKDE